MRLALPLLCVFIDWRRRMFTKLNTTFVLAIILSLITISWLHGQSCGGEFIQLQANPGSIQFPPTILGQARNQTVVITITSSFPVTITGIQLSPNAYFTSTIGDCISTLATYGTCSFVTSF